MSEWGNPPDCSLLLLRNNAHSVRAGRPVASVAGRRVVLAWRLTAGKTRYFETEYIGFKGRTRGTETSKYPEERKSTETPPVAASERGPAEP
jgi:hypothetical protein